MWFITTHRRASIINWLSHRSICLLVLDRRDVFPLGGFGCCRRGRNCCSSKFPLLANASVIVSCDFEKCLSWDFSIMILAYFEVMDTDLHLVLEALLMGPVTILLIIFVEPDG